LITVSGGPDQGSAFSFGIQTADIGGLAAVR